MIISKIKNGLSFVSSVRAEIYKLTVPSRKEVSGYFFVVIVLGFISSLFFFSADVLFWNLIRWGLGLK